MTSRRSFLRQSALTGGGIALSPLSQCLSASIRSEDSGALPRRFLFFLQGNGIYPRHVQPVGLESRMEPDAMEDRALSGFSLPRALEPLEPFKDRLTILQGLSGAITGPPLHSADFGALGCFPYRRGSPVEETIDAALAKALPGIFPHVGLGVSARPGDTVFYNVSAWSTGKALPTQCQPQLAFHRLFAGASGGDVRRAFDAKTNVLDFLAEDVRRLRTRLNAFEKEKLDCYLDALDSMGDRQAALAKAGDRVAKHVGGIDPAVLPQAAGGFAHLDAHMSIAASALIAGLTNVVTVSSGSGMEFTELKIDGRDLGFGPGAVTLHGVGHGSSFCGEDWETLQIAIQRRHVRSLAGFLGQLASVPEGDGTMLDNTVVVYLSDMGEKHHPECKEWPMLVIGDLGGRLKTRGRFLRYPWYGKSGHRTTANLYTTLLDAAGAPRDRFGVPDKFLGDLDQDGPLEELLT